MCCLFKKASETKTAAPKMSVDAWPLEKQLGATTLQIWMGPRAERLLRKTLIVVYILSTIEEASEYG